MMLQDRVATAIKLLLEAEIPAEILDGVTITLKNDTERLTAPFIVIKVEGGREEPIGTANYFLEVTVESHSPADPKTTETEAAHSALTEYVQHVLAGDVSGSLTGQGVESLHVFGVFQHQILGGAFDEREWVGGISFTAYACARSFAA